MKISVPCTNINYEVVGHAPKPVEVQHAPWSTRAADLIPFKFRNARPAWITRLAAENSSFVFSTESRHAALIVVNGVSQQAMIETCIVSRYQAPGPDYQADSKMHAEFEHWAAKLKLSNEGMQSYSINELLEYFNSAEFRDKNPSLVDLPAHEATAIYIHTAQDYEIETGTQKNEPVYRAVNAALRFAAGATEEQAALLNAKVTEFSPYIATLVSGLNFLKRQESFEGVVYRGLKLHATEIEKYRELQISGGIYCSPAFMSTTLDKDAAQCFEETSPFNVGLVADLLSGVSVSPLSQAESEEEILVAPNAKFRVTNVQSQSFSSSTDDYPTVIIHLQQVRDYPGQSSN